MVSQPHLPLQLIKQDTSIQHGLARQLYLCHCWLSGIFVTAPKDLFKILSTYNKEKLATLVGLLPPAR
jgi:hypothetical protein